MTQTLKRLEGIKCPSDPRPLKKCSPPKEDEVSLDWSGNEDNVDVFMEESAVAGLSGTTHRYVRTKETISCSDVFTATRKYHSIMKYLVPNTSSLVCCPLSVNKDHFEATWMLDSRASCHFTNNINDVRPPFWALLSSLDFDYAFPTFPDLPSISVPSRLFPAILQLFLKLTTSLWPDLLRLQ